jgi:NAD(P)-dependent dehydrogenase (short-subunit alcohol dehydrogenase family)
VSLQENLIDGQLDRWSAVIAVNLLGTMSTFREAAKHFVAARRGGRLLATSSCAGLRGEAGSSAYCASKGGINALVQSLACELAPIGVTVNAVAPGEIDTPMQRHGVERRAAAEGRRAAELRSDMLTRDIPAGRLGEPAEVAAMFAYLASDDARYVTGEIIRLDGGQLLV